MCAKKVCEETTPINAKEIIEKNLEDHMRNNIQGDDNTHWLAVNLYGDVKSIIPPNLRAKPDPKNWFPNTSEIIFARRDQYEDFVDFDDYQKRGFKNEDEMVEHYSKGKGSIRSDFPDMFNDKAEKAIDSWEKLHKHFCNQEWQSNYIDKINPNK